MTPILLALAALQGAPADAEARLRSCIAIVRADAAKGIAAADEWRLKGGGIEARQCLGLAYSAARSWPAAATAFEGAARDAETRKDPRSADLWTQAGNGWLAAGNPAAARRAFDAALAGAALPAELRGEVHLDRARAAVAAGDLAAARADIDKGLALVPADPFGWYLSAALARRAGELPRAAKDIARGLELAPREASILLEGGNIAGLAGDLAAARSLYARAAQAAPDSEAGRAAAAALAANAEPEPAPPAPTPAPEGR